MLLRIPSMSHGRPGRVVGVELRPRHRRCTRRTVCWRTTDVASGHGHTVCDDRARKDWKQWRQARGSPADFRLPASVEGPNSAKVQVGSLGKCDQSGLVADPEPQRRGVSAQALGSRLDLGSEPGGRRFDSSGETFGDDRLISQRRHRWRRTTYFRSLTTRRRNGRLRTSVDVLRLTTSFVRSSSRWVGDARCMVLLGVL